MTVLIKGMEMPTNCDDCFLGDFYCEKCQHIDGYKMAGNRPFACPLIKIPPHGRLIDADVFIEQEYDVIDPSGYYEGYSRQAVKAAPAIIEAEE